MEDKTPEAIPKDFKSIKDRETRKRLFKEAKEGKHQDNKNLQSITKNIIPLTERSPEEQKAIRRKAAAATNRIKGEKKTAKQILDNILPLYANSIAISNNENIPEDIKAEILRKHIQVTQYDLVMLSMLYKAQNGSEKAAEYIRDTAGDKPTDTIHNINENITEAERQLIQNIKSRLQLPED